MKNSLKANLSPLRCSLKFDLKMKLSIFLFILSLFQLQANNSYGQRTKVTVDLNNVTYEEIFETIEEQTEFKFFYNINDVDTSRKTSIKVFKEKIFVILDELFQNSDVEYKVNGKQIILVPKSKSFQSPTKKKLNQLNVQGVVTDTTGMPMPGVTVIVKGKNRGTTTDINGRYSIPVEPEDILIFSFVGFRTIEEPVNGRRELNIVLRNEISGLGEVLINAGYYNTTRRESTGNISRVTAEEIELQPVVSPLQALQGRMAGVEIIPGGSHPGMAATIRIRGINSLREEGNFPLYIINGVPINSAPIESNSLLGSAGIDPLNNLDINNIASIEILKDADATAIYGSRGANGVVLITTKSGKTLGTGLEARYYYGVATVPNRLNLLNTEEYLDVRRQAFENDGVQPTTRNAYDLLLWDQNRYTDWQDFVFGGTAESTNANISFSGGSENTSFRVGGSYYSQGTVFYGDYDYNKITGDLNLNHQSRDNKLTLNLSANYGLDVNNLVGNLNLNATVLLPPNAPELFKEDGTLNWEDWAIARLNNPLQGLYNNSVTKSNNLISNLSLSYEFLPGLRFRTSLGYTNYSSEELGKLPSRSYSPGSGFPNISNHLNQFRNSWIIEPQLNYDEKFGLFNLHAILGGTIQENTSNLVTFQGSNYASEALIGNIAAAANIINASNVTSEYRYIALFSRIGINWNRTYYINLTGRRDGSSRFGPNNRFANFGAIGTAWIFTEEDFIKDLFPFLSFGKFRGSFGTTGNDQIGDYGYLDAYEATRGPGGLYPTALSNPDYSWEVNKKFESALEVGLAEDKLRIGVSWYRNRSSNQLVGYPLPYMTGFTQVQANLPATVQNSGYEVEASSINLSTKNFQWKTSFNMSFPKNELLSYPDIDQSSYANTYRVGHPLNISLLYEYTGLDPETGLYTIRDVNEDGRFDYNDRIIIHDRNRKYFGGLNNNLSYKNLSLQFLWEFVKQEGSHTMFLAGRPSNPIDIVLNNNEYQKYSQSSAASRAFDYAINTTFPIHDASFLRLKTLSLGYNIPNESLQKIGLEGLRLFVHGQNLLTITPYDGLDPDSPYTGGSSRSLRTITGGVQINL